MRLTYSDEEKTYVAVSTFEEKSIPRDAGFEWHKSRRHWCSPSFHLAYLLRGYADEACRSRLVDLRSLQESSIIDSRSADCGLDFPSPKDCSYRPFQKSAIKFISERSAVLVGDEMGLGKTIEAIGYINFDERISSILVVSKATIKKNWELELKTWLVRKFTIGIATPEDFPFTDIVIINYDLLFKYAEQLRSRTWDVVIADECHKIKNPRSRMSKYFYGFRSKDKKTGVVTVVSPLPVRFKKIFMTGTPMLNRPMDLYPILHYLDPKNWKSSFFYGMRYCAGFNNHFGWDFTGHSNEEELQDRVRGSVMIRRMKEDVLKDLPPKVRQTVLLGRTPSLDSVIQEESNVVRKARTELAAVEVPMGRATEPGASKVISSMRRDILSRINAARHATALAKVPDVVNYVQEMLEELDKVVVFAHHHDVISQLQGAFASECPVVLTGETLEQERQLCVDNFQKNSRHKIFIGSILAAGEGITLTAASTAVFAELDWVPGRMNQAEDRLHRIGQKNSVNTHHLVLDGSIDAYVAKVLVAKQGVIDTALDKKTALAESFEDDLLDVLLKGEFGDGQI